MVRQKRGNKPKRVKSLSVRTIAAKNGKQVTGGTDAVRPLVRSQVKSLLTKSQ